MSGPGPDDSWLAALRAQVHQPPLTARVPLWYGGAVIGSVEPQFLFEALPPALVGASGPVQQSSRAGQSGWQVKGPLTDSLAVLAQALREAGVAHAWRDEQLAVTDLQGRCLGTVERAVVRPLGITTFAVHLAGFAPGGGHWLQQRSFTKPNDPGLWDTLMGGMIPASDSVAQALERETWEEAGLRLDQLQGLQHGGRITTRRPAREGLAGYLVEHIEWHRCIVPQGTAPANQDGEVVRFALMDVHEVWDRLQRDEFTLEAAWILLAAGLRAS